MSLVYLTMYFTFGCTFLPHSTPYYAGEHSSNAWTYDFVEFHEKFAAFSIDTIGHVNYVHGAC